VHTPISGVKAALAPFTVSGLGGSPFAFAGSIVVKGKLPLYGAEVLFQAGELLAEVSVSAADAAEPKPLAAVLARKLELRVARARAGKLAEPPVPLPGKLKPGPPPGGPELSKLAVTPSDLGAGTVKQQGYRLDKDLTPISDYHRELSPAGAFAELDEDVELFHSPTEASYTLASVVDGMSSKGLIAKFAGSDLRAAHIASFDVRRLAPLHAGDEARAVLGTIRLEDGRAFNMGFVVVRRGSVVETFTAITAIGVRLLPSALSDLANIAAARTDRGLHPAGSA
jgi:hypothetical protein